VPDIERERTKLQYLNFNTAELSTNELRANATTLQEMLNASQVLMSEKENLVNTLNGQLALRDTRIRDLENQLRENLSKAGADDELLAELTKSQLINRTLKRESDFIIDSSVEMSANFNSLTVESRRLRDELNQLKDLLRIEQDVKNRLAAELEAINKKTQASFEMADLSKYLTGVINDFNAATNTADATVNYIIKGLDVEMKAHISKTEADQLLMTAPSLGASGEEALSLIKFSIGAAPKI
jgi:hypothetical protein